MIVNSANMAYTRKDAIHRMQALQYPANMHIIKLLKWEDPVNFEKHIRDIDTWMKEIQNIDIKPSNSKLKADKYLDILFREPFEPEKNFSTKISRSLSEYSNLPVLKTDEQVYKDLRDIHTHLSFVLAEDKFQSIRSLIISHTK